MIALAGVTVVTLAVFIATAAIGDQRRLSVVLSSPAAGDSMPVTLQQLSITFSSEPNHNSVLSHLTLAPPSPGSTSWRGNTLVYTFSSALSPGQHRITVSAGASGRASERLVQPFSVTYTVRQPGIVLLQTDPATQKQKLVALRDGKADTLLTADAIADFSVSPDGSSVAVVSQNKGLTNLSLISSVSGEIRPLIQSPGIILGGVSWATDASALLVVREDKLPLGNTSVPRVWLVRLSGEFVAPIDPSGDPSIGPLWSPDAQSIAYLSPADGKLSVQNLSTHAVIDLGVPRGGDPAWSPDSKLIAYEAVPPAASNQDGLLQPIRVRSIDGTVDRSFGVHGEVRSFPLFLDNDTLLDLRRTVGAAQTGTDLLFESVKTGGIIRSVEFGRGAEIVTAWALDPLHTHAVFSVRSGTALQTYEIALSDGTRTLLPVSGDDPQWLP